jgi:hypothetical protein
MLDRLLGLTVLVIFGAVAIAAAAPALTTLMVTGTACFAIVALVLHHIRR